MKEEEFKDLAALGPFDHHVVDPVGQRFSPLILHFKGKGGSPRRDLGMKALQHLPECRRKDPHLHIPALGQGQD